MLLRSWRDLCDTFLNPDGRDTTSMTRLLNPNVLCEAMVIGFLDPDGGDMTWDTYSKPGRPLRIIGVLRIRSPVAGRL